MSVEFSNAYQEILLENAVAIIKQNFLLQTNLKLSENISNEKNEAVSRYDSLKQDFEKLKEDQRNFEQYKSKAEQNITVHEEKTRLQSALNDEMKKISSLMKQVKDKDDEIIKLKEYISLLEENVAVSKLKKLNPSKVNSGEKTTKKIESAVVEEPVIEKLTVIKNTDDGSSF